MPALVTNVPGSVAALCDEIATEWEKRPKVYGATGDIGLARALAEFLFDDERAMIRIDCKRSSGNTRKSTPSRG